MKFNRALIIVSAFFFILTCGKKNPAGPEEPNVVTVTDIDGNVYKTVKIGDQIWMAENLKVTHFRNEDPIPKVTDKTEWSELDTSAFCYYDNSSISLNTYGCLYNGYAVGDSRNIAPEGWHVSTRQDWEALFAEVGGTMKGGGNLKAATSWNSPNTGATNESGFSALAGGKRFMTGAFFYRGDFSNFWTSTLSTVDSTKAICYFLDTWSTVIGTNATDKREGYSVRCVKDY